MGYRVRFDETSRFPELALSKVVDRLEVNEMIYWELLKKTFHKKIQIAN